MGALELEMTDTESDSEAEEPPPGLSKEFPITLQDEEGQLQSHSTTILQNEQIVDTVLAGTQPNPCSGNGWF